MAKNKVKNRENFKICGYGVIELNVAFLSISGMIKSKNKNNDKMQYAMSGLIVGKYFYDIFIMLSSFILYNH